MTATARTFAHMKYVEVSAAPLWGLIPQTRRFVAAFCDRELGQPDLSGRVSLTTHELLENAVRYSAGGTILLRVEIARRQIEVFVQNDAAAKDTARLKQVINELSANDPSEYYQTRMAVNARQQGAAGLGLARIAAEAGMRLSARIQGPSVRITAVRAV